VSELWRGNIGFNFEGAAVTGQLASGDHWCLPCVVSSVFPMWNAGRDGAQLNVPFCDNGTTKGRHGLDSTISGFSDAVRARFPLALSPGDSLVVVRSWRSGEAGAPSVVSGNNRPQLREAAVLTCLDAPPAANVLTFRPAYSGPDRTAHELHQVDLTDDLAAFPNWAIPAGAPSIASVVAKLTPLQLDFMNTWRGRLVHPSANMADYARDMTRDYGHGILLLLCNIPLADKVEIAIRLIQIGIDQYGILLQDPDWAKAGGGHCSGRRFLTILAGYLLGEDSMADFFINNTSIDLTGESMQVGRDAQGVYWKDEAGRDRADPGNTSYIIQTSNVWPAAIIAVRALGLVAEWNLDDTLQYQDEYMAKAQTDEWKRSWHVFHGNMWDATDGGRHAP